MNAHAQGDIDRTCIERLVTVANLAPSAENCQPWLFRWDGHELSVHHDPERARHQGNHAGHLSLLAFGGVLAAIEIAAAAEGLAADVRMSLDPQIECWATVRLERATLSSSERAAAMDTMMAVRQRTTDRRLYRGGSASHPVFAQLRADATAQESCQLHVVSRFTPELLRYLEATESYILRHDDVLADVLRWIRFREDDARTHCDGVPFRALGFDLPALPALAVLAKPGGWHLLRSLGLHHVTRAWLRLQLSSSAALCAVTVRSERREHLVAAGRLAFTTWTALNRAGFGVQPMTVPSLFVYKLASGGLPASTSPTFVKLFGEGSHVLAKSFGWSDQDLPVWLMRTGLAEPPPARLRARRLPTSSILTFS